MQNQPTPTEPNWNILITPITGGFTLHMPNAEGELTCPKPDDGYLIAWPVNPHFTGPTQIINMLRLYGKAKFTDRELDFKECRFIIAENN